MIGIFHKEATDVEVILQEFFLQSNVLFFRDYQD